MRARTKGLSRLVSQTITWLVLSKSDYDADERQPVPGTISGCSRTCGCRADSCAPSLSVAMVTPEELAGSKRQPVVEIELGATSPHVLE